MFRITMLSSPLASTFVSTLIRAAPLGVRCFTEGPPPGSMGGGGRGQSSGPRVCYNCGEEGHMSFDCPKPRKERGPPRDRGMGGGGYGERRSPSSSSFREQRGPMSCYNCGQEGHLSRDCTAPRKERRDPSTVTCYNCGEAGHISTACTQPRKERVGGPPQEISQVKCYNCNEMGHYSRDCPQPRREQRAPRSDRKSVV